MDKETILQLGRVHRHLQTAKRQMTSVEYPYLKGVIIGMISTLVMDIELKRTIELIMLDIKQLHTKLSQGD